MPNSSKFTLTLSIQRQLSQVKLGLAKGGRLTLSS
jgi:hypothetical protein